MQELKRTSLASSSFSVLFALDRKKYRLPGKGSLRSKLVGRIIGGFLKKEGKVVRFETG